jgi:hypothetical protein
MMDTEAEAVRDRARFKRLRLEIEQMLTSESDYRQITKTLDYNCYSSSERLAVVRVLCDIRKSELPENDKKKVQKVLNHYAIEYDNLIVLKPTKA